MEEEEKVDTSVVPVQESDSDEPAGIDPDGWEQILSRLQARDDAELYCLIPEEPNDRSKELAKAVAKYLLSLFNERLLARLVNHLKGQQMDKSGVIHWFARMLPGACKKKVLKLKYPKTKTDKDEKRGQKRWCFRVAAAVVAEWVANQAICFEHDGQVKILSDNDQLDGTTLGQEVISVESVKKRSEQDVEPDMETSRANQRGSEPSTPVNSQVQAEAINLGASTHDLSEIHDETITHTPGNNELQAKTIVNRVTVQAYNGGQAQNINHAPLSGNSPLQVDNADQLGHGSTRHRPVAGHLDINPSVDPTASRGMANTPISDGERHDIVMINVFGIVGTPTSISLQFSWKEMAVPSSSSGRIRFGLAFRTECGFTSRVRIILYEYLSDVTGQALAARNMKISIDLHRERVRKCPDHFEPLIDFIPCVAIGPGAYALISMAEMPSLATFVNTDMGDLRVRDHLTMELARQLIVAASYGFDLPTEQEFPLLLLNPSTDVFVTQRMSFDITIPILRFGPFLHSVVSQSDWALHRGVGILENTGHVLTFILTIGAWRPLLTDFEVSANARLLKKVAKILMKPARSVLGASQQINVLKDLRTHPAFWQNRDIVTFTLNFHESLSFANRARLSRTVPAVDVKSSPIIYEYLMRSLQEGDGSQTMDFTALPHCPVSELFRLARNAFCHHHHQPNYDHSKTKLMSKTKEIELMARCFMNSFPLLFDEIWNVRESFGWNVTGDHYSRGLIFEFGLQSETRN